jgi:hypothetical protein
VPDVDSGAAETYLRLLAERKLRLALTEAEPSYGVESSTAAHVLRRVAGALITVGALGEATADEIQWQLDLALKVRLRRAQRRAYGVSMPAPPVSPRGAVAQRAVVTGIRLPVPDGSARLLSYAQTGSIGMFMVIVRLRRRSITPRDHPLNTFTATDDRGNSYRLRFSDSSRDPDVQDGPFILSPDPPPGLRWLEVSGPEVPACRVDLPSAPNQHGVATATARGAGELLLARIAATLLAEVPEFPPELRRTIIATGWGTSFHAATCLGDIVAGLRAAGALSADSPLPGQLAALCESLGVTDHGVTDRQRPRELPEHWESLLAYFLRRTQDARLPEDSASIALTLPEVDGIRFAVLGLHNTRFTSTLHVHASGLPSGGPTNLLPVIWLRDSGGRWHATKAASGGPLEVADGALMRLTVVPPLAKVSWIEVVVSGQSAEVRATIPLPWEGDRG